MPGLFEVEANPSKTTWLDSDGVEHDGDFTNIDTEIDEKSTKVSSEEGA